MSSNLSKRSVEIPDALGGRPLDHAVRVLFELTWGRARSSIEQGKVSIDGETATDKAARVKGGTTLTLNPSAPRPRPEGELDDSAFAHVDTHVVVVRKPAGISTVPYDEGDQGTLDVRVREWLTRRAKGRQGSRSGASPAPLGVVHRLDKETSGLVVFTRTWLAKKSLSAQFRAHTIHRLYLAIAHGVVEKATFRSHLVADRGDGLRGSIERAPRGKVHGEGQLAVTHVEPRERLRGATLVACRLETGRTHQIRVHLSESGHPIVGERVYVRGFAAGTALIAAPRLMLHAAELGFVHPATQREVSWQEPLPADFQGVLRRLRA